MDFFALLIFGVSFCLKTDSQMIYVKKCQGILQNIYLFFNILFYLTASDLFILVNLKVKTYFISVFPYLAVS